MNEISKAYNRHATTYEQAANVQHEVGERLFERLDYLKMNPRYVLDLGCGNGRWTRRLQAKYPEAQVVGFDLSMAMLKADVSGDLGYRVNGEMSALPFATGLFDLIFSNQVLHWAFELAPVLNELNRVLNTGACVMFSTLGPDTFMELRQAWQRVDNYAHVHRFLDMHDLGDALMAAYLQDPVVDMEKLTVEYPSVNQILKTLKAQGVRQVQAGRNPGLTTPAARGAFESEMNSFCTESGRYPVTYEVIYGHAWKGESTYTEDGFETHIPLSKLLRL